MITQLDLAQSHHGFFYLIFYSVDHRPEEGLYDLRINKANYDRDNGQFECRMKEGGTGMELHSKSVELTVLLNPSPPKISPSDPTATEGRPLNLTCASIGGSPPPQIYWYTEGQSQPLEANLIVGKNKDEPTQSVLTMIPTKEDDGNSYRCTVWNRALGQRQKLETSTKIYVNCKYIVAATVL
jgi:echinoid protein